MTDTNLFRYLQNLVTPRDVFFGEEEEEEEAGAGDGAGDDAGKGADGDGAGDGADDAGKDDDGDDAGKDDDKGKDDDLEINLDDFEPETRTKEEIAKDKQKDDDAGKDDDDDVDEQDAKTINKLLDKRLSPLEARIQAQNDELEANSFLQNRPEMLKYKPVMLKYMAHPAYKNVPVSAIAAIVSAKDAEKLGAAKERDAQKKVKESKGGGDTTRNNNDGGKKNWSDMPKAQFEAELLKIKSGGK